MRSIFTCLLLLVLHASNAQTIVTVAGSGTAGYSGDGAFAPMAQMNTVTGVAVDASNNVYISDYSNHRIRKVSATGIITTVAGTGVAGDSGAGGPATAAQIWRPSGIIVDPTGNIIFSDCDNHRIKKIDPSGIITNIAGNGTYGSAGDGGPATAAQLYYPESIALDASGNIYFCDFYNNKVRKIDPAGTIFTFAGNGMSGYTGDGGPAIAARLKTPYGIAISGAGDVYIGDYRNNVVRKINTSGIISTFAGTGVAGYSGDGGPATAAQFNLPKGIFFDSSGNLLVAEWNNHVVRKIDGAGIVSTVAGTGSMGYSGDGGPATNARLYSPETITVDAYNNIYIADDLNNVVRKVQLFSTVVNNVGGSSNGITIYPNPVNEKLNISSGGNLSSYSIFNVLGQRLSGGEIKSTNAAISVHDLSKGVYFIRFSSDRGENAISFEKN